MTTRTTTILVLLMILGAIVSGALLWNQLPEQMASHWNVNDEVDDYMSKPLGGRDSGDGVCGRVHDAVGHTGNVRTVSRGPGD